MGGLLFMLGQVARVQMALLLGMVMTSTKNYCVHLRAAQGSSTERAILLAVLRCNRRWGSAS